MGTTARDVMQADVHVIDPDAKLEELEEAFFRHGVTGFPVVEAGRLVGVVSRSDVVQRLAVERSRAGELSDYYRDPAVSGPAADHESFEDVAKRVGVRLSGLSVRDVMEPTPQTVGPDEPLREVARRLAAHGFHRVPVVDGERLVGIVTSLDIVRWVAESD